MAKFFISPTTETGLSVDPEILKAALQQRWQGVQLEDIEQGNRLFTWTFVGKEGLVDGYLNRKRQVVVLDGDVRDCAEFAQWYRALVDSVYELAFYDDAYSHSIPITESTQPRELSSSWL